MNYGNELNKTLKEEKNTVNRMYLNEILLQYRKYEEVLSKDLTDEDYYEQIAEAMTHFTNHLDNHKYYYNKSNKTGFKKNSPLMSSLYIDDFINSVIRRQKILKNKGVNWGKQSFSINLKIKPRSFSDMERNINFTYKDSPNFLQLTQKLDVQFRAAGRKNFSKYTIYLPLVVFVIHKKLHADEMIRLNYFAQKAEESFNKSKMIIICETLDVNFNYDDLSSCIDFIFVLRKKKSAKRNGIIHPDVIKAICDKVEQFLYKNLDNEPDLEKTGYLV